MSKTYRGKSEILKVIASDKNGKVLGSGTCKVYQENKAGAEEYVTASSWQELVRQANRMNLIDTRNGLAKEPSIGTRTKKLEESNSSFAAKMKALRAEYGIA